MNQLSEIVLQEFKSESSIPGYLVSATADTWYDFDGSMMYYVVNLLGDIKYTLNPKTDEEKCLLWEILNSSDWMLLSEIDPYLSLYVNENNQVKKVHAARHFLEYYHEDFNEDTPFPFSEYSIGKIEAPKYLIESLSPHFGHPEHYYLIDKNNQIFAFYNGNIDDSYTQSEDEYSKNHGWTATRILEDLDSILGWKPLEEVGYYENVYKVVNKKPILLQKSKEKITDFGV